MKTDGLFKVTIATYHESHRTTYHVVLTNTDRPDDAKVWDSIGQMNAFYSEVREHAVHTAKEWAEFLGVPAPEPCDCILCKSRDKRKS